MIDLKRLLRVPFVDVEFGFDISPDGKSVAFASNLTGGWEIYQLDLSASNLPKPASVGIGGKFGPKYSPDGTRLAYVVDFDGGENYHIFIQEILPERRAQPAVEGPPRDLTPNIDFAIQPNICWSPDGAQIAFLADITNCFGTYVMPSEGGEIRLLLENGFPAWDVNWSPDGRHLAVMSEGSGQDYFTFIIPLDGGEAFSIAIDGNPINAHHPAWSPDGTQLAFHSNIPNGFHQIGIFDMSTRSITWLTDEQANFRSPHWSQDGTQLAYVRAQGASDEIVVRSLGDGTEQSFSVETGAHYTPHFTPDGKSVIFAFNNPRCPPDFWMCDLASGELRQLTHSLPADMAGAPYVMPQEITYPGMDGTPVPALLFNSDDANETTPAVVVIHGGPNWHYQVEWNPIMVHLASRGWTVIAPNYRGSTGYGRDWQYAIRFKIGSIDTDDVAAGVQYLLENKLANPEHIAITGRSHGGYLTMTCLTRYPDLWCAGAAVVPFLNWFTGHENSREDLQHWDIENFGDPEENHERWYQASPFFFLDKVKAPVQLICGENDPRCPASESVEARDKLLSHGCEVDFALYEGEGHAFLKIENVVDSELRRVNFLAKALN
jgi:dipeptidyl aminopeptidase/acylaminoacyl peptidase